MEGGGPHGSWSSRPLEADVLIWQLKESDEALRTFQRVQQLYPSMGALRKLKQWMSAVEAQATLKRPPSAPTLA